MIECNSLRAASIAVVFMCLLAAASAAGRPVYDASGNPTGGSKSAPGLATTAPSTTNPGTTVSGASAGTKSASSSGSAGNGGSPKGSDAPAAATGTGYKGFAKGGDILKISLGRWTGDHTCDVSGSFFGRNSFMGQDLKVYMEDGKVRMHSIVNLIRPAFGCIFESVGSCTKGSDTQCDDKSLAPIVCKVDGYPRWDDNCGGVSVPRLEIIRVCIDGASKEQQPVEISPTCSSISGTYKKAD